MITFNSLVIVCTIAGMSMRKNPIKSAIILIIIGVSIFSMSRLYTGKRWIPLVILILFTGGVLIVLIILSSIIPNRHPGKDLKILVKLRILIRIILLLILFNFETSNQNQSMLKQIIIRKNRIYLMTLMIIMYFAGFLMILSKDKISMRTTF